MTTGKLTQKDFASDQEVRWCPGCGDYSILKAVQKALADLGVQKENTVFVSGIGCSSRFPYYMDTYGFHTIHGRAPSIATGVKLANPDLDVWVVTGDGDGLSIGGNHMLHAVRRNIGLNILLFNNEIYGLTKGQYSPTSHVGTKSPSTPRGSLDQPINPCAFALGANARFVARTVDTAQAHMLETMKKAQQHQGTSFVEIYQNCVVYNDGVFADFSDKKAAPEEQLHVEHGQPMIFGVERDKGLRLNRDTLEFEVVRVGAGGVSEDQILVHDKANLTIANMLVRLPRPDFPVVLGVIYEVPSMPYETVVGAQLRTIRGQSKPDLSKVLRGEGTWEVSGSKKKKGLLSW